MIFPNMNGGTYFTFQDGQMFRNGRPVKNDKEQEPPEWKNAITAETIKINYLSDVEPITQKTNSDWIDLRAAERTELKAGEYKLIPLGIAMQLPDGYEAIVAPRSSTFKNWGIIQTNSIGIIDESYCGPNDQWMYPVYATKDTVIEKNDRICQFRIVLHQPSITFVKSDLNENSNRSGFGSTGRS